MEAPSNSTPQSKPPWKTRCSFFPIFFLPQSLPLVSTFCCPRYTCIFSLTLSWHYFFRAMQEISLILFSPARGTDYFPRLMAKSSSDTHSMYTKMPPFSVAFLSGWGIKLQSCFVYRRLFSRPGEQWLSQLARRRTEIILLATQPLRSFSLLPTMAHFAILSLGTVLLLPLRQPGSSPGVQ